MAMMKRFVTVASILAASAVTAAQGLKPSPRPEGRVAVERDLTVRVAIVVDVPARRVEHSYAFANRKATPVDFEVRAGTAKAAKPRVSVEPGATEEIREVEEIAEKPLGRTGRKVRVDPRLRLARTGADSALLVANYDFDIELRLPPGARILKSLTPFRAETPTRLRWKQSGLTVMPPIDILYTLAEESVTLSKQVTENGRDVTFKVVVTNTGGLPISRLDLRAQFPNGVYEVNDSDSSGTFRLLDGQTYRWSAQVTGLAAGRSHDLTLELTKRDAVTAAWDFEILAYNASGDLVATAPAAR
jgi:uncharacterized repeat protein (TIGR01451 family)